MEQVYLEGVENCVCKNLYSVLFGENGVGTYHNPQLQATDPNLPATLNTVSEAHKEEMEHNTRIMENIARFGNFIEPRHLEIDESRLI